MIKDGRRKLKPVALVICLLFALNVFNIGAQAAVFDTSKAMQYKNYARNNTIEQSIMFIGTHLVHAQALTDELYEKAMDSATDSNQTEIYYKSELTDGTWFNITEASGLDEISGKGIAVDESELADLWVTHYTGSDGITKEVKSGKTVNIFNTPDPYDLYNLPELEPIRIQYDNVFKDSDAGVAKYYKEKLWDFFATKVRNNVTDTCDRQLDSLQKCYEELRERGEDELAEIVSKLMGKVDSRRRAEVFSKLAEIDDNLLNELQEIASGSQYDKDKYDDEQFVQDANVSDAIGTSMQNCQQSYIEHSGNMLVDGTTVLKEAEYDKSVNAISLGEKGYSDDLRYALLELQDLYHIQDDVIADPEGELAILDGELLEKGENKYINSISAGTNAEYKAAVNNGDRLAIKHQILDDQKTETNAVREEFQFLINAKKTRLGAESAIEYIYKRIDACEAFYTKVPEDDYKKYANETIDAHMLWLQDVLKSIMDETDGVKSEISDLEGMKEDLSTQFAQALDDNDLGLAKKLEAEIDSVNEQISEKEEELNNILTDPTSSASDKAQAGVSAGDRTTLNNINSMKNDILADIANGELGDGSKLSNVAQALASLGAESALAEILDKLENTGADSSLINNLENAVEDSRDSELHDIYGGVQASDDGSADDEGDVDGDGTGDGVVDLSNVAGEEILGAIRDYYGMNFGDLNDAEKAAVTAMADIINEEGCEAAGDLAKDFLNQCLAEGNPYAYNKLTGEFGEYIPHKVLAFANNYRYVYNDSQRQITLTRRAKVYKFEVFSDKMTLRNQSEKTLTKPVAEHGVPYLYEDDAVALFESEAEYIENTIYGICLSKMMKQQAEDIADIIREGAQ